MTLKAKPKKDITKKENLSHEQRSKIINISKQNQIIYQKDNPHLHIRLIPKI